MSEFMEERPYRHVDEIARLRFINAELLAALKAIAVCDEDDLPALCDIEMNDLALRAIAKAAG